MIFDMQYGSTGKGLLAGYLALKHEPDTVVTAWGPNAGHTFVDKDGRKYVHRMLANGIVSPNLQKILIGPGSVIDLDILLNEIKSCRRLLKGKSIYIHPNAAIVTTDHAEQEKESMLAIGSTMKGTGAAIIQRIKRDPTNQNVAGATDLTKFMAEVRDIDAYVYLSEYAYRSAILASRVMQIEGAQGYSLSLYHGVYPYCTSRDVTPHQVMADCALPWRSDVEVVGTMRTFPIRVANRRNEDGEMVGTSGPCYFDQEELSWADIGVKPELTTVTKLPRRVFSFSQEQIINAALVCNPSRLFLNFANYMRENDLKKLIANIEENTGVCVKYVGHGPKVTDIEEIY